MPSKPNAFMFFVQDYQRSQGRFLAFDDAMRLAGPEWNKLSEAERNEYKARAKSAKENTSRPNVSGQSVPQHVKPQYPKMDRPILFHSDDVFAAERATDRDRINFGFRFRCDTIDIAALHAELIERDWFFVSCEHVGHQESDLAYPTVELAIVQFSFKSGIRLRQNFYIIPRTNTAEDLEKAKSVARSTNRLFPVPVPYILDQLQMKFYDISADSSELWSEVIKLVVAEENLDDPGAIYCLASEFYSVQSAFHQLKADALKEAKLPPEDFVKPTPEQIKCVEDLLQATLEYVDKRQCASDVNYLPKAADAVRSFDQHLEEMRRGGLHQYEECACDFHAALSSSHCALAKATAACWAFLRVFHDKGLFVKSLPLRKLRPQALTTEPQPDASNRQQAFNGKTSASFGRGHLLRNEASGFSEVPFGGRNPRAVNVGVSNAAAADVSAAHPFGPSAFSSGVGSSPSYHQAAIRATLPAEFIRKLEAAGVGRSKVTSQKWNPGDGGITTREVDYVPPNSR